MTTTGDLQDRLGKHGRHSNMDDVVDTQIIDQDQLKGMSKTAEEMEQQVIGDLGKSGERLRNRNNPLGSDHPDAAPRSSLGHGAPYEH